MYLLLVETVAQAVLLQCFYSTFLPLMRPISDVVMDRSNFNLFEKSNSTVRLLYYMY